MFAVVFVSSSAAAAAVTATATAAAAGLPAASAQAEENYYGAVRIQQARQSLKELQLYSPRAIALLNGPDSNSKISGSLAFGYLLPQNWRIEAEYTLPMRSDYNTLWRWTGGMSRNVIQTSSQRLMLNGYKDFPLNDVVSLYGGLGIGLARIDAEGYQGNSSRRFEKNTQNNLAYSLTLGSDFRLTKTFTLGVGYRHVDMGKVRTGQNRFANASGQRDEQHAGKFAEQDLFAELRAGF